MNKDKLKAFLEGLYYVYSRRELVYPDPLYFLYRYNDLRDREIAGMIASGLAYGRVAQIMKSVDRVLSCLGERPYIFLKDNKYLPVIPEKFKHRFTTSYDMNNLLYNITHIIREYNSIEGFLAECLRRSDGKMFRALDEFAVKLSQGNKPGAFPLVSAPKDGSACKRLFLFLRWMVRCDDVDPGGWEIFRPSQLLVPMDTHMMDIALRLALTARRGGNFDTSLEVTQSFSELSPNDPVKYDFTLSRFGIRTLNAEYITVKS